MTWLPPSALANFGGGWENEWFDALGAGGAQSDLLITPFGAFPLFATFF